MKKITILISKLKLNKEENLTNRRKYLHYQ